MDCIFCGIAQGKLPSAKVYEDEFQLAFLDLFPVSKGHTLLIPKQHTRNLFDFDSETAQLVYPTLIKLAKAIKAATGCVGLNIVQNNEAVAGQIVFHSHIHLIPRYEDDGIHIAIASKAQATAEQLTALSAEIKKHVD
jgi:histidine triad (HIT) family protein